MIDRGQGEESLPPDLEAFFEGAAAGYNQFLFEVGRSGLPDPRCRGEKWVRPIDSIDVKRVSRADYAMAYLLPILVAAAPPALAASATQAAPPPQPETMNGEPLRERDFAAAVDRYAELSKEGGSNAVAIGRSLSESGGGMLLANPHRPWNEPFQRFYPLHQTVPGRFDALGANLIGRPRVGFAHDEHVAWTSTVSTAKRMSFYRLRLVPGEPTQYLFDGKPHALRKETVHVQVIGADGELETRSHAFYSTHFGAMLVESDLFHWTDGEVFAVRVAEGAFRGEASAFDQLAARSVRESKAIHDRHQFMTVNLIAADASGEVLYGDPAPRTPSLLRHDFVTNSNDSHWLPNPASPLSGFPEIFGSEGTARTLRTRSGLRMVQERMAGPGGGKVGLDDLQAMALANESEAGRLLRDAVVRIS